VFGQSHHGAADRNGQEEHHREAADREALERGRDEWAEVIALIRAEMDQGTDVSDPKVQSLARRWQDLVERSSLGDPGIRDAMKKLWEEQGDALAAQFGEKYDSRPIWGYITKAGEAMTK